MVSCLEEVLSTASAAPLWRGHVHTTPSVTGVTLLPVRECETIYSMGSMEIRCGTCATLVSQLLYASPAWWGYLKADERNRLQAVVKKTIRYGYLPRSFSTLDELREDSDEKLFLIQVQPNDAPPPPQPKTPL